MGFHKRYINDDQVISIFQKQGCQGVIDWFTKGVDAIISSGKLTIEVNDLVKILPYDENRARNRIAEVIMSAVNEKEHGS